MPCYHPLHAYVGRIKDGKMQIAWSPGDSVRAEHLDLPCGQCIGCRLDRAKMWGDRCWHESLMHERNCFITLTYNDENLPQDGSVHVEHFQKFMKRLRKKYGEKIRFFHCGEYGEKLSRPHYHAILFGIDFDDKCLHSVRNEHRTYTSSELEQVWGKGFATVGAVTQQSAGYVARYVLKKVTGDSAEGHYNGKAPEYITMSRRPGIGLSAYKKFQKDFFPSDECVTPGGKVSKPPRYYLEKLAIDDEKMYNEVKMKRKSSRKKSEIENDSFRRPVKEEVKLASISMLSRPMEEL